MNVLRFVAAFSSTFIYSYTIYLVVEEHVCYAVTLTALFFWAWFYVWFPKITHCQNKFSLWDFAYRFALTIFYLDMIDTILDTIDHKTTLLSAAWVLLSYAFIMFVWYHDLDKLVDLDVREQVEPGQKFMNKSQTQLETKMSSSSAAAAVVAPPASSYSIEDLPLEVIRCVLRPDFSRTVVTAAECNVKGRMEARVFKDWMVLLVDRATIFPISSAMHFYKMYRKYKQMSKNPKLRCGILCKRHETHKHTGCGPFTGAAQISMLELGVIMLAIPCEKDDDLSTVVNEKDAMTEDESYLLDDAASTAPYDESKWYPPASPRSLAAANQISSEPWPNSEKNEKKDIRNRLMSAVGEFCVKMDELDRKKAKAEEKV